MASITTGTNYCMKWQNFQVHLAFELYQLLKLESMVDVTLKADGEAFHAHRIILSASSPFFQEILSPIENDCHPIIILADVPANDVKAILEFIYYGEIKVEGTNIFSVLKTAQNLKITALLEIENHIIQNPICTSTASNEVEVTITTPLNKKPVNPKAKSPKKTDQSKVFGLQSLPSLQETAKKPISSILAGPSLSSNYSNVSATKTSLPFSSPKTTPVKSNVSNKPSLPVSAIEHKSPSKVPSKRTLPLLSSVPSKAIPSTSFSSIDKSIPSTSFTSIDPPLSNPLLYSKSIYYSDSSCINYDNVISKPLAELQPLETIENTEKFNHKDGSQFIALEGFSIGDLSSESSAKEQNCNTGEVNTPSISNESSKNTEVHVVQFDGLDPILDDDEDPLGPWLTLKTPSTAASKITDKKTTPPPIIHTQDGQQFYIVGADGRENNCSVDEFFMSVDDSNSTPASEPVERTLSKQDILSRAIDDIAATNKSISEIVNKYNIPRSTLYYRARSSGLKLNDRDKYSEFMQTLDEAVDYVKRGATLKEACDKFKVAKTVLWRKVNKTLGHGALTLRSQCRSKYSQSSFNKALVDLKNGVNLAMVCKKYNIPFATLHRAQNRLIDLGHLTKEKVCMPRYDKDMTKQARLLKAVRAVQDKSMTTAQAAICFQVPKVTLWRKLTFLNKVMNMDIEEIEMDSLDMEDEEGDQNFMLSQGFKQEALQDDEMMILMMEEEEDSMQDGVEYIMGDEDGEGEPPGENSVVEENKLMVEAGGAGNEDGSHQSFMFKTESEEEGGQEEEDADSMATSFILVNSEMCLKI